MLDGRACAFVCAIVGGLSRTGTWVYQQAIAVLSMDIQI